MTKSPLLRLPRHLVLTGIFLVVAMSGWILAPATYSQAPLASTNNAALTGLLTKLKAQQDQMVANQTKIEAQTAQLKEEIRQAKIYAGRSGGRR